MMPFKILNAYMWQIQQLGILLMVSLPWIIALNEADGDKTFNLKIGFDLTHGSQEDSAVKVKKLKESDPVPYNNGEENHKRILRAQDSSSSSSSENQDKKENSKKKMEMKAIEDSSESDDDTDDSGSDRIQRSTKGLRPDEYEANAGPAAREEFDKDSESENSN